MIDFNNFFDSIENTRLAPLTRELPAYIQHFMSEARHGDLPNWLRALSQMPALKPSKIDLKNRVQIGTEDDLDQSARALLIDSLQSLTPWRKGPFDLFGIHLDTEWRSDWKWDRVLPHLESLAGKTVLDIGCGNGYHCLRIFGEDATRVVGIDPSPRFVVQFHMLKRYLGDVPVDLLPIGIEHLPAQLNAFDVTFSMGVLYHRRSPMDHLRELKETLAPGGSLVLETLVIDGPLGEVLVPEGRYAMMPNVWFIPTPQTLESWLRKMGFIEVNTVDVNTTTFEEQRSTQWMPHHSLKDFLDPTNPSMTAEGHPAPKRAVIIARKPK